MPGAPSRRMKPAKSEQEQMHALYRKGGKRARWQHTSYMRTLFVLIPVVGNRCKLLIFAWRPMAPRFRIIL
jgi:hypothetical protein